MFFQMGTQLTYQWNKPIVKIPKTFIHFWVEQSIITSPGTNLTS